MIARLPHLLLVCLSALLLAGCPSGNVDQEIIPGPVGSPENVAQLYLEEPIRVQWRLRAGVNAPYTEGQMVAEAERALRELLWRDREVKLVQTTENGAEARAVEEPYFNIVVLRWMAGPSQFPVFHADVQYHDGVDRVSLGRYIGQSAGALDPDIPIAAQKERFRSAAIQALRPLASAILENLDSDN